MTPRPRSRQGTSTRDRPQTRSLPAVENISSSNHVPEKSVSTNPNVQTSSRGKTVWIFGYGSLCWKPDFQYLSKAVGYIRGYSRKFWQGNTAHRGTPGKPGRVATLVEEENGEVWGVGYEVFKNSPVLDYLWERECLLGGYHIIQVTFHSETHDSVEGLAYLATPSSPGWLGRASAVDISLQVAQAKGPAGENSEYVCRLAAWIRTNTPVRDRHLDLLDLLIKTAKTSDKGLDKITPRERVLLAMKKIKMSKGEKRYEHSISRTQA